jgi:hypothetical protein
MARTRGIARSPTLPREAHASSAIDPSGSSALRGWLLVAFLVTTGGIVTGAGFFAVGGIFALLSDLFALAMGLVGLAVVGGLHAHAATVSGVTAPAVRTVGLAAYAVTIVGSLALVLLNLGVAGIPGALALGTQFAGMTAQGAWFLGFGLVVLRTRAFPRDVGWMLVVAGAGYLSFGFAAALAPGSVAAMTGGFIGVIVYLVLVLRLRSALAEA